MQEKLFCGYAHDPSDIAWGPAGRSNVLTWAKWITANYFYNLSGKKLIPQHRYENTAIKTCGLERNWLK